jgi:hypothetical protein
MMDVESVNGAVQLVAISTTFERTFVQWVIRVTKNKINVRPVIADLNTKSKTHGSRNRYCNPTNTAFKLRT